MEILNKPWNKSHEKSYSYAEFIKSLGGVNMELTVGKLKELLSEYNDDVKIISVTSNFEMGNNYKDAKVQTICVSKEIKTFRDAFDGGSYSSEIYRYDDKGEEVILING